MPHINIKHFPLPLDEEKKAVLVRNISQVVQDAFACPEDAISIALEPVAPEQWRDRVGLPEFEERKHLLCKQPNYWKLT